LADMFVTVSLSRAGVCPRAAAVCASALGVDS
jgi:hypothetical protein